MRTKKAISLRIAQGTWLLAVQIILICFSCQQPSPKGFGIKDPENVFFLFGGGHFSMYEYNRAKDTLLLKANYNRVIHNYLFYNVKLDKIYNFGIAKYSESLGIHIYDGPKGRPKFFAERRTAFFSVHPYKDDYLISSGFFFPPPQKNQLVIGDTFYYTHGENYTKAYLLETSEASNRFTKEYDFYQVTSNSITKDSMIYFHFYGGGVSFNMETGKTKKMFSYNFFHQDMLQEYYARDLEHFLHTPDSLPPPNQLLVVGKDLYMIPKNFVLGTSKKEKQIRQHLYNTYKANTLYKHLGNNTFEKVLEVPMSENIERVVEMDDCLFFVGTKGNQPEVVRYDLLSKNTQILVLNKKDYLVHVARRTKDYLVLLLRNFESEHNKYILGLVPKDLTSEPKFYDPPPIFNVSEDPYLFGVSSQYGESRGFMQNNIIQYDGKAIDSIFSGVRAEPEFLIKKAKSNTLSVK